MLSLTSTRAAIENDTVGGDTSFAADCTLTTTELDRPRRPPASTANPVTVNAPVVAVTVSVSVYVVSGGKFVRTTSQSVGGVVGTVTALRDATMNPTRWIPPSCCASMTIVIILPLVATAPAQGASRFTLSS